MSTENPSNEQDRNVMQAAREEILHELGAGSSHPEFAPKRLRIWRAVALIPIAVALGLLIWRAWNIISELTGFEFSRAMAQLKDLIESILKLPENLMPWLAAGTAALLTACLTIRASMNRSNAAGTMTPRVGWQTLVYGSLAGIAFCVAMTWAASSDYFEINTRRKILVACLIPLYVLQLILEFRARSNDKPPSILRVLSALVWSLSIPIALGSMIVIFPSAGNILSEKVFGVLEFFAKLFGLQNVSEFLKKAVESKVHTVLLQFFAVAASFFVLIVVNLRAASLYKQSMKAVEDARRRVDETSTDGSPVIEEEEKPLWWPLRILNWILCKLGLKEEEDEPSKASEPTAEVAPELRAKIERLIPNAEESNGTSIEFTESVEPDGEHVAPDVEGEELSWLFGGFRPSVDQQQLIAVFQERWLDHLSTLQASRYGHGRESHADVLVEAETYSDVDAAVAACAVFACVARGQRVLIIVGNRIEAEKRVKSMRESLRIMGFDVLYGVDLLTRDSVAEWCPPAVERVKKAQGQPPDILVAPIEEYEHVFHGGAYNRSVIATIQRSLEVVIVEHADELVSDDQVRMHLPFIIDKHRLMLSTENRAMQLLMSLAPIGPCVRDKDRRGLLTIARRKLAERFFGGDAGMAGNRRGSEVDDADRIAAHFVYLRARATRTPAAIKISNYENPKAAEDARRNIARMISRTERMCFISLGGDGALATSELEMNDLKQRAIHCKMSDLGAIRGKLHEVEWYVLVGLVNESHLEKIHDALRWNSCAKLVYVESATDWPKVTKPKQQLKFPVFPAASSSALFVAHLRSIASVLTPDVPNRREEFARFGLEWNENRWRSAVGALIAEPLQDCWRLDIDGSIDNIVADDTKAWPAVFVRHDSGIGSYPVEMSNPIPSGFCLVRSKDSVRPGLLNHEAARDRYATWMTSRGLQLGRTDLAYFRPVVHDGERQRYKVSRIEKRDGGILVHGEPVSGDDDFVVPVRRTKLTLPPNLKIDGPVVLRMLNAYLFRMTEPPQSPQGLSAGICTAEERIVALSTATHDGRNDNRRPIPEIKFNVHVGVTLLIIGGDLPATDVDNKLLALYEGVWNSNPDPARHTNSRQPWHALTRAFNYAIEQVAPSLMLFANFHAFKAPSERGGATIMVLEPVTTHGTAAAALTTILDDRALSSRFLEEFERAAREGCRSRTAMRVDGDDQEEPDSGEELLRLLRLLQQSPPDPSDTSITFRDSEIHKIVEAGADYRGEKKRPTLRKEIEIPVDANHQWIDGNLIACLNALRDRTQADSSRYGLNISVDDDVADAVTRSFGINTDHLDDEELCRRACVRVSRRHDINVYGPHYELMITNSIEAMRPYVSLLERLALEAGINTPREVVGLIASMVQHFQYELQRTGGPDDGKDRMGVQMPITTLHALSGDCDSLSVLIAALLRASRVARSGIVLIEDGDVGHAMVAVELPIDQIYDTDFVIRRDKSSTLLLIESTGPWNLGVIDPRYKDRHVRLEAFG